MRLLGRFFRQGEFLMARLALDWEQRKGLRGHWQTILHRNDLLELPDKLQAWAGHIDHRIFPNTTAEQAEALVPRLRAVAFRLQELVEARDQPQAEFLVRELLGDVRPWREAIQQLFERWAVTPGVTTGDLEARLVEKLAQLEARIDATFEHAEAGQLREKDYESFYRLLGAYRGLSEAVVAYVEVAREVDWAQWQEARF